MNKVDPSVWFKADSLPQDLAAKHMKELSSLKRLLQYSEEYSSRRIRFGDDKKFEPDFVLESDSEKLGLEVTEIYGNHEQADDLKAGLAVEPATREEWLAAIKRAYDKKLSNRADGQRYDRSKFDKIVLLFDDKSQRVLSLMDQPVSLMPNGTPIGDTTLFQQEFEHYSDVIDESFLIGLRKNNQGLFDFKIKGHLNL